MDELMEAITAVFPDGTIGTDFDGQIVVYTNLRELAVVDDNGKIRAIYVDMDTEDEWNPPS